MIEEIPSSDDFHQAALDSLNLSWDVLMDLARYVRDAYDYGHLGEEGLQKDKTDGDELKEYWTSAQNLLGNALTLLQQGQELGIKARIAEVSPFLVIMAHPRDWPASAVNENVSFGEFRSLNAADLIKVHNTVHRDRLSSEVRKQFDKVRKQRNAIMHSVKAASEIHPGQVAGSILRAYNGILRGEAWFVDRLLHYKRSPEAAAWGDDYIGNGVLLDWDLTAHLLSTADLRRFFGFDRNGPNYCCPVCHGNTRDFDEPIRSAILRADDEPPRVQCVVCQQKTAVERRQCENASWYNPRTGDEGDRCDGNIFSVDGGTCLTCLKSTDDGC